MVGRGWQRQAVWVGAVLALGIGSARTENLDAGKSAPALFAATCSACHANVRGLAKNTSGLASYLREHYTSSPESAAALAAYLSANAAGPAAKQGAAGGRAAATPADAKRRPGQTAEPPKTEPAARPPTVSSRPDSMIEPVETRRHREEPAKESAKGAGRGKRQPAKQETAAPAQSPGESPAGQPAAAPAEPPPAAAPVAAAPAPDQPAFSAPSP